MKKLIIVACVICLSSSVNAGVVTTTELLPPPFAYKDVPFTLNSNHSYTIVNASNETRNYRVCFTETVCPEYPYHTKSKQVCFDKSLSPGQKATDRYSMLYTDQLPLSRVQCNVHAETVVSGAEYGKTEDNKKMQIN